MKRSAEIYITPDQKYIMHTTAKIKGHYTTLSEPVERYDDLEEVIAQLPRMLALSGHVYTSFEEGDAVGENAQKKVFKLAGVRSNRALVRATYNVGIIEKEGEVTFSPMESRKGGVFFGLEEDFTAPLTDKSALRVALEKAIAGCRREGA